MLRSYNPKSVNQLKLYPSSKVFRFQNYFVFPSASTCACSLIFFVQKCVHNCLCHRQKRTNFVYCSFTGFKPISKSRPLSLREIYANHYRSLWHDVYGNGVDSYRSELVWTRATWPAYPCYRLLGTMYTWALPLWTVIKHNLLSLYAVLFCRICRI